MKSLICIVEHHLDTWVLLVAFMVLIGLVYHMAHDPMDSGNVNWAREQAGIVLGALIMRRSSQKTELPNGEQKNVDTQTLSTGIAGAPAIHH